MSFFLALDPSDDVRARVVEAMTRERATVDAKWVPAENLHVTLVFVGPLAADRLAELTERARAVAQRHGPLALGIAGAGTFDARVLWLGVTGDRAGLERLATGLAGALEVVADHASYTPHLTLARAIPRAGDQLLDAVAQRLANTAFGAWVATGLTVYESKSGRYFARAKLPLGNPEVSKTS